MIPLKLQLKNFLSYGSTQTIDFEPHRLICLSGKNGHGKSALLDALTWALWGQARKTSGSHKSDEALLRMGEISMFVIVEFACREYLYRIRREFTLQGTKSITVLDFGMINQHTGTVKSLTEKTIRLTQDAIIKIIGLDYETFINSVFLRQGQSNEFSQKTPKDRKEILLSILGLHKFEEIKQRALENIKSNAIKREQLHMQHIAASKEIERLPELNHQLNTIEHELFLLKEQECNILHQQQILQAQIINYKEAQVQYRLLEQQEHEFNLQIAQQLQEVRKLFLLWRTTHHNIIKLPIFDYQQEQNVLAEIAKAEEAKNIYNRLQNEILQCTNQEQKIIFAIKELFLQKKNFHEQQLLLVRQKISEMTNTHDEIIRQLSQYAQELFDYDKSLASINQESGQLIVYEASHTREKKIFERRKLFLNKFKDYQRMFIKQVEEINYKLHLLQNTAQPQCTLCEQMLSIECQILLHNKLAYQLSIKKKQECRFDSIVNKLQNLIHTQEITLLKIESMLSRVAVLHTQKEHIIFKKQLVQNQHNLLNEQLTDLANKKKLMAAEILVQEQEIKTLVLREYQELKINNELAELAHQKNSLQEHLSKTFREIDKLADFYEQRKFLEKQKQELLVLEKERALQEHRKVRVKELCESLKAYKEKQRQLVHHKQDLSTKQLEYSSVLAREQMLNEAQKNLKQQHQQLLLKKGALEQQKINTDQNAAQAKILQHQINFLEQDIQDYQLIAQAAGKDGIQALLIEQALPQLETEANYLLSRLTDNHMHLMIDSLRDLKNGAIKETLDIKISDTLGIRPYELFSGGEAFRIDLALRIALSKLLAAQAGTTLQTLIIDEGFGSQDEEGLHRIMDALYKIQDDFAKIIIISHLSSMKEQFPSHFIIHKTPSGSTVQVMLQG